MLETLDYTTRIAAHRPFYISIYIDMIVRESEVLWQDILMVYLKM